MKTQTKNEPVKLPLVATLGTNSPIPRLPAYPCDDDVQVHVWCRFCQAWHHHGGATLGHRIAHRHGDSPCRATGYVLVGCKQPRSEAGSGRLRTPRRAKGAHSRPSGAPSLASHAATTCNDRRFRVLPPASNAVMCGDLGDSLQACGSTVTAPTGTGRGHQTRDVAAQSARRDWLPLPSHGSPPRRSGQNRRQYPQPAPQRSLSQPCQPH